MSNISFTRSTSGRILLFTSGLNFAGVGLVGLSGDQSLWLPVMASIPLASILFCVAAVLYSIERDDESTAVMIISLPFIAGIAYALLFTAPALGTMPAIFFLAIGVIAGIASFALSTAKSQQRALEQNLQNA